MQSFKPFYSKILLFGEYSVISGSNVLSIPFPEFSGKLAIPPNQEIEGKSFRESNQKIIDYINRLSDLLFVIARYENHVASSPEIEWKSRG